MEQMTNRTDIDHWNPSTYDSLRRQLIPSFDLLYESAAAVVALSLHPTVPGRILDLGAGTGLLSGAVRKRVPTAHITLADRSEAMLERAATRFAGDANVTTVICDLLDPVPLDDQPFDAIVSALAIHHLEHEEKQLLFSKIFSALVPGGIFVNVEQLLAPTPDIEAMYDAQHEHHVLASNTPPDEWAAGRKRMRELDKPALLEQQLEWMRQAGFRAVDCLSKDWRFSVYAGWA